MTNRRGFLGLFGTALLGVTGLHRLFAGNGPLKVTPGDYPELAEDNGYKVLKNVNIEGDEDNIILIRRSSTEYLVLSSICRHKKCNVKFRAASGELACPCHGSKYDLTGKNIKGPSEGPLPVYKAELNNQVLTITRKS